MVLTGLEWFINYCENYLVLAWFVIELEGCGKSLDAGSFL